MASNWSSDSAPTRSMRSCWSATPSGKGSDGDGGVSVLTGSGSGGDAGAVGVASADGAAGDSPPGSPCKRCTTASILARPCRSAQAGSPSGGWPMRCSRSVPCSSASICAALSRMPHCAATRQSSMACARRTPPSRPTMRAAPLMEWAARMHASRWLAAAGSRSRASRPALSTSAWDSASSANSSSSEASRNWSGFMRGSVSAPGAPARRQAGRRYGPGRRTAPGCSVSTPVQCGRSGCSALPRRRRTPLISATGSAMAPRPWPSTRKRCPCRASAGASDSSPTPNSRARDRQASRLPRTLATPQHRGIAAVWQRMHGAGRGDLADRLGGQGEPFIADAEHEAGQAGADGVGGPAPPPTGAAGSSVMACISSRAVAARE